MGSKIEMRSPPSARGQIQHADFVNHSSQSQNTATCSPCCAKICAYICKIFSDLLTDQVRVRGHYPPSKKHTSTSSSSQIATTMTWQSEDGKTRTVTDSANPLRLGALFVTEGDSQKGSVVKIVFPQSDSIDSFREISDLTPKSAKLFGIARTEDPPEIT